MPDHNSKFYLTTPIYYVNARPHIGHAYTTIAADVIARRHRLLGDDTYFLTGTDEHGQKIERSAAAAGIPPQHFADQVSASFQNLWKRMGITNDDFIRTTDDRHKRGVQKLFTTLQANGAIYLDTYTGQYCISDEAYVDGPPGVVCPDCGNVTETVSESNYYFKLSEYQERLLNLIEPGANGEPPQLLIQPESRRNEVLSFLRGDVSAIVTKVYDERAAADRENLPLRYVGPVDLGTESPLKGAEAKGIVKRTATGSAYITGALKDLSISRTSFKWGIPVPGDESHVIYVWLDALANYMTALGYGSDDPADIARFEKYWPADLHLVGKEIIRFHCVYWPAFLMAANLPLPKAITAHGWLLFQDSSNQASKMSKSKGNIVRTETILDAFGTLLPQPTDLPLTPTTAGTTDVHLTSTTGGSTDVHLTRTTGGSTDVPLAGTTGGSTDVPLTSTTGGSTDVHLTSTTGGSRGLQPPESTPPQTGALAPGLSNQAWKHQQDLFASDVLRYFLLREIPFGQDGSFSFDALVARYNSDLANGYGNLVSRTLAMIHKYFDGNIPFGKMDEQVGVGIRFNVAAVTNNFVNLDFSNVLQCIMNIVRGADAHITSTAPWKIAADASRTQELKDVLYTAVESIRIVNSLIEPILPFTAAQVFTQLGIPTQREPGTEPKWSSTKLGPLAPIFPRAPKELIQIMTDMETPITPKSAEPPAPEPVVLDPTHPAAPPRTSSFDEHNPGTHVAASAATTTERPGTPTHTQAAASGIFANAAAASSIPDTPQIAIDDFVKIDLRVAQIILAERIPKADKLLRLEVDLGYETRQILSGIAEWYTPEDLIGRRIVVIANLAPRKMRGLESHGMLLAASHGENGKPILATFAEDIALGSRLR